MELPTPAISAYFLKYLNTETIAMIKISANIPRILAYFLRYINNVIQ